MMDYSTLLSARAASLQPSGIRKFFDILAEMPDAISLGIGEPDFQTPWHIRDAGIRSLEKGFTKYSSNAGMSDLRRAICDYLLRRFGLTYEPDTQLVVTVGGSEAIDLAIRALVNPGDEVLIPQPSFVCYGPITTLAGGTPVPIALDDSNDFRLSPEQLEAAVTERSKVLVLPFPSNPTGGIMCREDYEALVPIIEKHNLILLSDEIYAELTYEGRHCSPATLPQLYDRTVVVNGMSKAYSMTGWRLGYACAPASIMELMMRIHQYAIMCAPTTSQYAALEAVVNGDDDIEAMKEEYDGRRRFLVEGLRQIGLPCFDPLGAFYAFPCVKQTGLSSEEFAERLLMAEKVACIPGNAFGESGEGYLRLCYASSMENLHKSLDRIDRFVHTL